MLSPLAVLATMFAYVGLLFVVARRSGRVSGLTTGRRGALIYTFSLAVYCTTWTYYGSVGSAANAGLLFLTIYLGPTLAAILWWTLLRKMVRATRATRVTDIADFLSARYGKSPMVAALVTGLIAIGIAPYLGLQFKAIVSTLSTLTAADAATPPAWSNHVGLVLALVMMLFTIAFGARRLDSSERHPGLIAAVAIESGVKLGAFLAAGIFVVWGLFDGWQDIAVRLANTGIAADLDAVQVPFEKWVSYLLLSMSAFMFLPRQFHVLVVENEHEDHIRTAMWLLPVYLLAMNILVVPIAAGGLLKGLSPALADQYVMILPLKYGPPLLAVAVFIGGFSAASSMIMICSLSLATMISNNCVLPLMRRLGRSQWIGRHLLRVRWVAIGGVILLGYGTSIALGDSYTLVNMGMISFAAALQLAPAAIGGLFWRGANRAGAFAGIGSGFAIWFYTLMVPSFVHSGWLPESILTNGPGGVGWLRPEHLFGMQEIDPISHAVFWTMAANVSLFIVGSLLYREHLIDQRQAAAYCNALEAADERHDLDGIEKDIPLAAKFALFARMLGEYFEAEEVPGIIVVCVESVALTDRETVSVLELAELTVQIESRLAGAIGSAAAHAALKEASVFDGQETAALSAAYGQMLAQMNLGPSELLKRIDHLRERERLLENKTVVLEERVNQRTEELGQTQRRLHQAERMASIGTLAAGIAHEINNPVSFIASNLTTLDGYIGDLRSVIDEETDLISRCLCFDELSTYARKAAAIRQEKEIDELMLDLPDLVRESLDGAQRIAAIVQSLREFSRVDDLGTTRANPNQIIETTLNIVQNKGIERIAIELDLGDVPQIDCYAGRLGQVVLNLLLNAANAIDGEGVIRICTWVEADQLHVDVTDTGRGIRPENIDRIFDPFYTTMDVGQGKGLGLSTVHGIVTDHGGTIEVTSVVGEGSTFSVRLPLEHVPAPVA